MGPKPTPEYTLERRDNDKGYSPENCYWATRIVQNRNQTWTRKVTIEGKEYIAAELSEKYHLKTDTIVKRAKKGMTFNQVTSADYMPVCQKGHPFVPENTYTYPNGDRKCRICIKASQWRYRERRGLRQSWSTPILIEVV